MKKNNNEGKEYGKVVSGKNPTPKKTAGQAGLRCKYKKIGKPLKEK